MRDDIHRRLPLPPVWKRLLKACARPADQPRVAERSAAAVDFGLRELRRSFAMEVAVALQESGRTLFPTTELQPTSDVESEFLRQCRLALPEAATWEELARAALIRVASDRARAQVREAHAQACLLARSDASAVERVLRRAVDAVDKMAVAERFLSGSLSPLVARRTALDTDADLSRGVP